MTPSTEIAEIEISAADAPRLREALGVLRDSYSGADDPALLRQAFSLGTLLPASVREAISEMHYLETHVALVVRGGAKIFEASPPGPTPRHWRTREPHASALHDLWLLVTLAQFGDPVCWSSLQDGRLFNDVLPIAGEKEQQTGPGGTAGLAFHVDDAFHDHRCDTLGLLCLRDDDAVPTMVASLGAIEPGGRDLAPLFESRFLIRPNSEHLRHTPSNGEPRDRLRPVLFGSPESPYLRVDPACTTTPADARAAQALTALHERLRSRLVDIVLAAGDVLVIDNARAVHGQRPFTARNDGTDRWLRKLRVVRDLRRSRPARHGVDGREMAPF